MVFLTDELPYPLLLGQDALGFTDLARLTLQKIPALAEDSEEGPSQGTHSISHELNPEPDWSSKPGFLPHRSHLGVPDGRGGRKGGV